METEKFLTAIALKYDGDWEKILDALIRRDYGDLVKYYKRVDQLKCKYVTILSDQYPARLRQYGHRPPFVLFYYGDLSLISDIDKNISVVGSREFSEYGEMMTRKIVKDLCDEYVVVSGLAMGIDAIAHETALDFGGKTIAVLGNGIDYCYPSVNKALYERIKNEGLVVSEYPNSVFPNRETFPLRNRIIAMLSKGLLVTEAHARSGTLISVNFALQMNKDVLCVPYPAGQESQCNRLISEGAYLVESGNDVKDVLRGTKGIW